MVMVVGGAEIANESYLHGAGADTRRFIADRFHAQTPLLNATSQLFFDRVKQIEQNYLATTTVLRTAIAAERQAEQLWTMDIVQDLVSIAQFQSPPPCMVNYLMAEPTIRKAYHRQMCNGYDDIYVDNEPDNIGITHSTYRQVTDGMVIFDDHNDLDSGWKATTWSLSEENELAFTAKASIRYSMRNLADLYLLGESDPTDKNNGRLS